MIWSLRLDRTPDRLEACWVSEFLGHPTQSTRHWASCRLPWPSRANLTAAADAQTRPPTPRAALGRVASELRDRRAWRRRSCRRPPTRQLRSARAVQLRWRSRAGAIHCCWTSGTERQLERGAARACVGMEVGGSACICSSPSRSNPLFVRGRAASNWRIDRERCQNRFYEFGFILFDSKVCQ